MNIRGMLKMALAKRPGGELLQVGDVAPPFEVKAHNGETIRLADFAGRKVVLYFYPRADTPGCTMEACSFRDHYSAYQEKDVVLFGVSFDPAHENRVFAEKYHLPFLLLCDTERKLGLAYGACDDPKAEYPRRITYVIGKDGRIERAVGKVDVRAHAAQLLNS